MILDIIIITCLLFLFVARVFPQVILVGDDGHLKKVRIDPTEIRVCFGLSNLKY